MKKTQRIAALPKIDLHCHLDGSVDPGLVRDFLRQQGREISEEELLTQLQVPDDCPSLAVYLERFGLPLSALQSRQNLTEAAYRLAMNAAAEGVVYLEVRYAPDFCKEGDMKTTAETIEAIEAGLKKAREEIASGAGSTSGNGTASGAGSDSESRGRRLLQIPFLLQTPFLIRNPVPLSASSERGLLPAPCGICRLSRI